jgi:hypothetical protein
MAKRRAKKEKSDEMLEANVDELGSDPGEVGPESGGQSGDSQGLSSEADAGEESVEELADTEQSYEAGVLEGVEEAGEHPERPVRVHSRPVTLGENPEDREDQ